MANHVMENEYLRVTIADEGAELISVWDKTLNQERADAGLSHLGTPPAVPPAGEKGPKKELVTDEEIEKMANGF